MPQNHPIQIISDSPEEGTIQFGCEAYAKTIAGLIANRNNRTPFVIGIYGSWGSGKTTLMRRIQRMLEDMSDGKSTADGSEPPVDFDTSNLRKIKTVWFQAWKYNDEDAILAALIEEIFKTMQHDDFFEQCKASLEKMAANVKYKSSKIIGKLTKLAGLDISELFAELEYKKKLGYFDVFQDFFDRLIWDYLNWRPKATECEKTDDKNAALVIFIDDLDRCPKERIVKVLETVKLFMDKEGCIFVIGAANDIIENALKPAYGDKGAARFMDKIVQVAFKLRQIPAEDLKSWVSDAGVDLPNREEIVTHIPLLAPALGNNPRQLKRFLNNLALQFGIISAKELTIDFTSLLYFCIFEYVYPELIEDLRENPKILSHLKGEIQKLQSKQETADVDRLSEDDLSAVPHSLRGYIKERELTEMVTKFSGTAEDLMQLTTLSGIVEVSEEAVKEKPGQRMVRFEEMVLVEAGVFLYGDAPEEKQIEHPYYIDIYPVTNDQFRQFIEDDGYVKESFWSPEGLKWKSEQSIDSPKFWNDEKWNKDGYPVVGVSYYEAEAYAKWAGKSLPTELQWERAARGTDGRIYPWGDEFDSERCNTNASGIGQTSRVTRYPNGRSSEGCYDMAGNVWEWTRSLYTKGANDFALRGGSWFFDGGNVRCAARSFNLPVVRSGVIGFRCSRTKR